MAFVFTVCSVFYVNIPINIICLFLVTYFRTEADNCQRKAPRRKENKSLARHGNNFQIGNPLMVPSMFFKLDNHHSKEKVGNQNKTVKKHKNTQGLANLLSPGKVSES